MGFYFVFWNFVEISSKENSLVQLIHTSMYIKLEPVCCTWYMVLYSLKIYKFNVGYSFFTTWTLFFIHFYNSGFFLFGSQLYNRSSGDIKTCFAWGVTLYVVNISRRVPKYMRARIFACHTDPHIECKFKEC